MGVKDYEYFDGDELENYMHTPKMGRSSMSNVLEEQEQERLFKELDNLKRKGIDKDSKEYQDIRNKLIVNNMELAIMVANSKYLKNLDIENEDLKQIAMEALIKAVDQYDISYGKKFSIYAVPTIFYSITKEWSKSQDNSERLRTQWQKLEKFEEEMLKSANREPTDEEIKNFLGISDISLETLKKYINYHLRESLENLNEDDEEVIISELMDDERIEQQENKTILNGVYIDKDERVSDKELKDVEIAGIYANFKEDLLEAMDTLTEREKEVLELRYGLKNGRPMTFKDLRNIF